MSAKSDAGAVRTGAGVTWDVALVAVAVLMVGSCGRPETLTRPPESAAAQAAAADASVDGPESAAVEVAVADAGADGGDAGDGLPSPCPLAPVVAGRFVLPALYDSLFVPGTTFDLAGKITGEGDDYGLRLRCRVAAVRRFRRAAAARLRCDAVAPSKDRSDEVVPLESSPDGVYVATPAGLFRAARIPGQAEIDALTADHLFMLPEGGNCLVRDDGDDNGVHLYRSEGSPTWWCSHTSSGGADPMLAPRSSSSICFRPGAGLVGAATPTTMVASCIGDTTA